MMAMLNVIEYFYADKDLNRADSQALVEIIKSLIQTLYSGEYVGLKILRSPRYAQGEGCECLWSVTLDEGLIEAEGMDWVILEDFVVEHSGFSFFVYSLSTFKDAVAFCLP